MNEKNSLIKNFVAKLKSKTKPPFTETVNPTCPARTFYRRFNRGEIQRQKYKEQSFVELKERGSRDIKEHTPTTALSYDEVNDDLDELVALRERKIFWCYRSR